MKKMAGGFRVPYESPFRLSFFNVIHVLIQASLKLPPSLANIHNRRRNLSYNPTPVHKENRILEFREHILKVIKRIETGGHIGLFQDGTDKTVRQDTVCRSLLIDFIMK